MPSETLPSLSPSSYNVLWLYHQMEWMLFVFQGSSYLCVFLNFANALLHFRADVSMDLYKHHFIISQLHKPYFWNRLLNFIISMIFLKGFLIISPAVLGIQPFNRKQIYKINFTTGYSSCISQKTKRTGCFCLYINTASTEKCKTSTMQDINMSNHDHGRHCNHSFILRETLIIVFLKKLSLVPWYFDNCSMQSEDRRKIGYVNTRVTQIKKYIHIV